MKKAASLKKQDNSAYDSMERFANMKTMSSNFPFERYDKNGLFINTASIGCFWECEPLSSIDKELGMFEDLVQHILPDGAFIQVSIMADPRVSKMVDRWLSVDPTCRIRRERAYFFKEIVDVFDFRIFISFSLVGTLEDHQGDIFDWIYEIEQKLRCGGLKPRRCGPDDLLDFADFFFQTNKNAKKRKAVLNQIDQPMSEHILPPKTTVSSDGEEIVVGDKRTIKTLLFENVPKNWTSDLVEYFTNGSFEFPFIVQTTLMVEDQKRAKKRVESWANHAIKTADVALFGKKNMREGEYVIEAKKAREDVINRERRIVKYSVSGAFFTKKGHVKRAESDFYNFFRKFGWSIQPKIYTAMPMLVSMLPTAASSFVDIKKHQSLSQKTLGFKTTFVDEAIQFMPIISDFKGHNKEDEFQNVLWLGKKGRQITPFSLWNRGTEGRNCAVIGQTGSGKSVFMQDMVRTMLYDTTVFVLDRGKSFRGICYEQNGQFIEFTKECDICLNPFSSFSKVAKKEEKNYIGDFIQQLRAIVTTMISPSGEISNLEVNFLGIAIAKVVREKEDKGEISDIRDVLLSSSDPRERDLGTMLFDFCDDGIYSRYFTGPSNVAFEKKFVVIEFADLTKDPKLKSVIAQLILMRVGKEIYDSPRGEKKGVVADEGHDFFKGKTAAEFLEIQAREIRKYGGFLMTGTQSIEDFSKSPAAKIAYEQSFWRVILKTSPEGITKTANTLQLSDEIVEEIKKIRNVPGVYSEGVIVNSSGEYFPIRLMFDKFSIRLYSTTGEEVAEVEKIWKENKCSWIEAIDIAMARKQRKIEQEKMELAK